MKRVYDRIGERYCKLVIIDRIKNKNPKRNNTVWICQCDCGNIHYVPSNHWKEIKSCGCFQREKNNDSYSKTKLYSTWKSMKARCNIKSNPSYKNYGGRGISICEEWKDFFKFKEWAIQNGYDENKTRKKQTLDRINNNGNYEPNNCRWVNSFIQANNTSRNIWLEYNGIRKTMAQWSRILKIDYKKFSNFIRTTKIRLIKKQQNIPDKVKKKVLQLDINNNPIKIFNSITEASKETKISITSISRVAKGERKPVKNFNWKFI